MSLIMAGIDYNRAGVDIRSRFSFEKKELAEAYMLMHGEKELQGSVLISTCNRTELWLSTAHETPVNAKKLLCALKGLPYEENKEYLFTSQEDDAADHLFRLASGLESRILGEDQIITQVKDALGKARENDAADHILEVLFRQAVTAGKRVKSEVNLSTADRSVIHQALRQLKQTGYEIEGKTCMVIGNGMMGKLAAQALRESGAEVTVTVRQYHNGQVKVPEGCSRIDYEDRFELFPQCDLVVSATSSPNLTIQKKHLDKLELTHDMVLIDLAVPRDIEASCGEAEGISLYDIDSFDVDLESEQLLENIKTAEQILNEEKEEFQAYYEGRDLLPIIGRIKKAAASDISGRMRPVYKKTSDRTDAEKLDEQVSGAASRMMNKLLFGLREEMDPAEYRRMLAAMQRVLDTEAPDGTHT